MLFHVLLAVFFIINYIQTVVEVDCVLTGVLRGLMLRNLFI